MFRSIKLYFLMGQGDFFVQFMDLAEDEMKKNMDGMYIWFIRLKSVCDGAIFYRMLVRR